MSCLIVSEAGEVNWCRGKAESEDGGSMGRWMDGGVVCGFNLRQTLCKAALR